MKFRNLAAAAAAVSMATAPALAAPVARDAAPVDAESELGGSGVILGILAAALVIAGIIIAADGGGDDAVSQ